MPVNAKRRTRSFETLQLPFLTSSLWLILARAPRILTGGEIVRPAKTTRAECDLHVLVGNLHEIQTNSERRSETALADVARVRRYQHGLTIPHFPRIVSSRR